jgi:hypothetical protein
MGKPAPPPIKYTLPAGWEVTDPGEMRVASFHVHNSEGKQADVSVVPLPGMMGRELENVNRWRSTVGLPAVTEEELPKLAELVEMGDLKAQLFDQAGENPGSGDKSRILVAILGREGVAWYFKMNGDEVVVSQQKPAFVEFLKSVTFPQGEPSSELPPSHPAVGTMASAPVGGSEAGTTGPSSKPSFQLPAGWKEVSGGPFLVAKFAISGSGDAQAAVNVSMSAGDGGGLVGNINRWRGQLGLAHLSESEIGKLVTSVDTAAGKAMFIDMAGTDARTGQKARLIGAVVPQNGQTWFYKLMGNEEIVDQQREAFSKFVQTAKYPNAS